MERGPVLELHAVSKYFCRDTQLARRYGLADIMRELSPLTRARSGPRRGEFASLEDVSIAVRPGEAVAIMGPNGAGKTTLLRLIAGLIKPDRGTIEVNGRINSVIELGQGLNQQLSGRENVELQLAWRGVPRSHVPSLIETIVEFAELGEAIDSPMGTYSTGMRMRLAFAIAIHVPCDLLLLDEVLAVGDIHYQRKCMSHIQRHLLAGGSLILVSHNVPQVLAICERGIVLDQGQILFDGVANAAADILLDRLARQEQPEADCGRATRADAGPVRITRVAAHDGRGGGLHSGGTAIFELDFVADQPVAAICSLTVWTMDLAACVTGAIEKEPPIAAAGSNSRRCRFDRLNLTRGTYAVRFSILDPATLYPLAMFGIEQPPLTIKVAGGTDRVSTLQRNVRQLVELEYCWDQCVSDTAHSVDRRGERNGEFSSVVG